MRWRIAILGLLLTAGLALAQGDSPPITPQTAGSLQPLAMLGNGEANDLAFSPSGKLLAVATSVGVLYTETRAPEATQRLEGAPFYAMRIAMRPDGAQIAAGSTDSTLRIWDLPSGKLIAQRTDHGGAVNALAYSADGQWLATAGGEAGVIVWNVESLEPARTIPASGEAVRALAFSLDGRHIATAGELAAITVWDAATGEVVHEFQQGQGAIGSLVFLPDGRLVSGGESGAVQVWDIEAGEQVGGYQNGDRPIWDMAVRDDGLLVTVGGDEYLRVQVAESGESHGEIANMLHHRMRAVAVSGTLYAIASAQDVSLWDSTSGTRVGWIRMPEKTESAAFSPDGTILAVGCTDGVIEFWDVATRTLRSTVDLERGSVMFVLYRSENEIVAAAEDGTLVVVNPLTGDRRDIFAHEARVSGLVSLNDDRDVVVSTAIDGTLRFTEIAAGISAERERRDNTAFTALALTGAPGVAALGTNDGYVTVARVAERRLRPNPDRFLLGGEAVATALAISPNGRALAVGSTDSALRVFNVGNLQSPPHVLTSFFGPITGIEFSPDGSVMAVTSQDNFVRLIAADGSTVLYEGAAHTAPALRPAFSSDARLLATTGEDGVTWLWGAS